MIAFDTNILVYAHRRDSSFHARARDCVRDSAEGTSPWAIPWPCVHEFLATVTNPRVFQKPAKADEALAQLAAWQQSPTLRLLGEGPGYWDLLASTVRASQVTGPRIHDARVAALALYHGVSELLTADRDFSRFRGVAVRNPLA